MNEIIEISSLEDPRIKIYTSLTERQLRNRREDDKGIFIAESAKVIKVALQSGCQPVSFLCEERHIAGDGAPLFSAAEGIPVFTGSNDLLTRLTGYNMSRGILCAMKRLQLPAPGLICSNARRVAVIHSVVDNTNIGVIFRAAAALGIDAVLLTRTSCDPLNRRSVRVSMGTVFRVPWTWIDNVAELHDYGFKTMAMALTDKSIPLDSPILKEEPKLAIILGNEGDGLPMEEICAADYTVRIQMYNDVDSLNVGAAAAIAFWELRTRF